jgi:hypothetical protein
LKTVSSLLSKTSILPNKPISSSSNCPPLILQVFSGLVSFFSEEEYTWTPSGKHITTWTVSQMNPHKSWKREKQFCNECVGVAVEKSLFFSSIVQLWWWRRIVFHLECVKQMITF